MPPLEVTPQEVKRRLDSGEPMLLIDCREPEEYAIGRIEGAQLIPMRSIPGELAMLESAAKPVVVYCHHGIRSLRVAEWLRGQGLEECQSMSGGVDGWSLEIDPSVPRYN